jgi:hypothetical protein
MTLSAPVVVVTILSLVLGFVTHGVQSGSLLGIKTIPQPWLPYLTIFGTFLGGTVAYFTGLGTSMRLDAATIFYGVVAGFTALLASSTPGIVIHAHVTLPAKLLAMRAANDAAKKAAA